MTRKSVLLILAAAAVLISAALAAGCVSTSDDIVGTWYAENETGVHVSLFYDGNTGLYAYLSGDELTAEQEYGNPIDFNHLQYTAFTWEKNADGTYTASFLSGDYICTLDSAAGILTADNGLVFEKEVNAASGVAPGPGFGLQFVLQYVTAIAAAL